MPPTHFVLRRPKKVKVEVKAEVEVEVEVAACAAAQLRRARKVEKKLMEKGKRIKSLRAWGLELLVAQVYPVE